MFKLQGSDELRHETALRFKAALDALPEQIDVLQSIEVALNENPGEDWDIVLTAIVPTMDDVAVYAKHPAGREKPLNPHSPSKIRGGREALMLPKTSGR